MSTKRVTQIIIAFIAVLTGTSVLWQSVNADTIDQEQIGMVALPGAIITNNDTVTYSDAMALQYASQFNNQEKKTKYDWTFEDADAFEYSNALALEYVSQFSSQAKNNDPIAYSNALPLLYASQFNTQSENNETIEYSNALPELYAQQYGNWKPDVAHQHSIQVDVAEAGTRFVFDDAPVYEDGMPDYGNSFVTQGYLYPAGTLGESNGVLADGSPEFPELVIGNWTCRGWFIGEGAYTETGPWVITTQVYDLGEEIGAEMVITEGFELSDIGVEGSRAITGGTGQYSKARGSMTQTLLGFNESMGVNLQVTLQPTR